MQDGRDCASSVFQSQQLNDLPPDPAQIKLSTLLFEGTCNCFNACLHLKEELKRKLFTTAPSTPAPDVSSYLPDVLRSSSSQQDNTLSKDNLFFMPAQRDSSLFLQI